MTTDKPIVVPVPADLWAEVAETLDRVGCQFWACEGPTLTPIPMVTCHACTTLARVLALTENGT